MNKLILHQNLNVGLKYYRGRDTAAEFKWPRWRVNLLNIITTTLIMKIIILIIVVCGLLYAATSI
jgi:hypothetical protein